MATTTTTTVCKFCTLAAYDHLGGGHNLGWYECAETARIYGANIVHNWDCESREDPGYGPCDCACNRSDPTMVWTRAEIHDATGFDNGDLFTSEDQVREYFTVDNIKAMFDECPYTQAELDEMAEAVIANKWHMDED